MAYQSFHKYLAVSMNHYASWDRGQVIKGGHVRKNCRSLKAEKVGHQLHVRPQLGVGKNCPSLKGEKDGGQLHVRSQLRSILHAFLQYHQGHVCSSPPQVSTSREEKADSVVTFGHCLVGNLKNTNTVSLITIIPARSPIFETLVNQSIAVLSTRAVV